MRRWVRRCSPWSPAGGANSAVGLHLQRSFYGPRERRLGLLGFLRLGVWLSGFRAFKKGFLGNLLGEGFILGGVYVIGPGQQVIRSSHTPISHVRYFTDIRYPNTDIN